MPLYQYSCNNCGMTKEEAHSVSDRYNCGMCTCGGSFGIDICPVKTIGFVFTFTPHYDYSLGKYFESAEHKKAELLKLGKVQIEGQMCPSGRSDTHNKCQVPCTKSEAERIDMGQLNPHADSDRKITVG